MPLSGSSYMKESPKANSDDDPEESGGEDENAKITSKSIEFVPSLLSTPRPSRGYPKSLSKSLPVHLGPKAIIEDGKYRIEQPAALLIDIWNIIAPFTFSQTIQAYIDEKLETFVAENFECQFLRDTMDNLIADNETRRICNPLLPSITKTGSDVEQISSLIDNIHFRRKHEPETVCIFEDIIDRLLVQGFKSDELKPPMFDDVPAVLKAWCSIGVRLYTLDNSSQAYQQNFCRAAAAAAAAAGKFDEHCFAGHFNSKGEYKCTDFVRLATDIRTVDGRGPFYLTSSFSRAKESEKAGVSTIIVLRDDRQKYSNSQLQKYLVVKNLSEFDFLKTKQ